jgi:hypothetical protein
MKTVVAPGADACDVSDRTTGRGTATVGGIKALSTPNGPTVVIANEGVTPRPEVVVAASALRAMPSGCRMGQVHLPPQEVSRLVEDLLAVLGIGHVAGLVP